MINKNERNSFNPRLENILLGCIVAYGVKKSSLERGDDNRGLVTNIVTNLTFGIRDESYILINEATSYLDADLKEVVIVGFKMGLLEEQETLYYINEYLDKDLKELEMELLRLSTLRLPGKDFINCGRYKNLGLLVSSLLNVKEAESCLTIDEESFITHAELINSSKDTRFFSLRDINPRRDWTLKAIDALSKKKVIYIDKYDFKDSRYDVAFFNMVNIYHEIKLKRRSHFYEDILKLVSLVNKKIVLLVTSNFLYSGDNEDKEKLLKLNVIESVIKLPVNSFSASFCLIVINKEKVNDSIKFLDATNMSKLLRRYAEINYVDILSSLDSSKLVKEVPISYILEEHKDNLDLSVDTYKYYGEIKLETKIKLEDVSMDIFRGVELRANRLDDLNPTGNEDRLCKMVVVKNLTDGLLNLEECEDIKYSPKLERYLLQDGDILLSARFSTLKTSLVRLAKDELAIAADSVIVIRVDKDLMLPEFLLAFLKSETGSKILETVTSARTIRIINISALKTMPVINIHVDEQEKLTNELNEINTRIQMMEKEIEVLKKNAKSISEEYFK